MELVVDPGRFRQLLAHVYELHCFSLFQAAHDVDAWAFAGGNRYRGGLMLVNYAQAWSPDWGHYFRLVCTSPTGGRRYPQPPTRVGWRYHAGRWLALDTCGQLKAGPHQ
jgi:hypothetical protein